MRKAPISPAKPPAKSAFSRRSVAATLGIIVIFAGWFLWSMNRMYRKMRLVEAAYHGDVRTAHALLDGGVSPNDTLVYTLVYTYVPQKPVRFWDAFGEMRHQPEAYYRPLQAACEAGKMQIVRLLLERGADPNPKKAGTHSQRSPLETALVHGHLQVAQLLLEKGASLPSGESGGMVCDVIAAPYHADGLPESYRSDGLSDAARMSLRTALIKQLISNKADISSQCSNELVGPSTALGYAADTRQHEIVHLLLAYGAKQKIVMNKNSALFFAVKNNDAKMVRLLLAGGADVNMYEEYYGSCLKAARRLHLPEMVALLKQEGAKDE